jgi:hypothetical protein
MQETVHQVYQFDQQQGLSYGDYAEFDYTETLSDSYADSSFISDFLQNATFVYPGEFTFDAAFPKNAERYLAPDVQLYRVSKLQYQIRIAQGRTSPVAWFEVFEPGDTTQPIEFTNKTWIPTGTEKVSGSYIIDPLDALQLSHHPTVNGTYQALLIDPDIAIDANRDGEIHFDGEGVSSTFSDSTTENLPYGFWLNNDIDRQKVYEDEGDMQDDGDPKETRYGPVDSELDRIPCPRDLEDFSRLWIHASGIKGSNIFLGLKWKSNTSPVGDGPAIKLYEAAESDGGFKYLTDTATQATQQSGFSAITNMAPAQSQSLTPTMVKPVDGADWDFVLPQNYTNGSALTTSNPVVHLLFEGCRRGKGQLCVVLLTKDSSGNLKKIADGPGVWLDLKDIKEFYERWSVGDGPVTSKLSNGGGAPNATAAISGERLNLGVTALEYDKLQSNPNGLSVASDPDGKKYVLYVHGWNMHPWEKDAFAETAFKRLFWQGYKGRFGTFQWPTTYHDHDFASIFDYDVGEQSAWQSSVPLLDLLQKLNLKYQSFPPFGVTPSSNVFVIAHSMGNVVVGEALRLAAAKGGYGKLVNTYIATQAAVPVHAYDPTQPTPDGFFNSFRTVAKLLGKVPVEIRPAGPETPNIYNDWFTPNADSVGARFNCFNVNDYALARPIWQSDQALKPDIRPDRVYFYNDLNLDITQNDFASCPYLTVAGAETTILTHVGLPPITNLDVGTPGNVVNRYEILAFAAEPRCRPLGTSVEVAGFGALNLSGLDQSGQPAEATIWPADDSDQTNGPYSTHRWHSAQFRFTIADQFIYWRSILQSFGIKPNPLPE